ncbi:MAG TPA: hypothetical protein VFI23_10800 [Rhizomicrobium sp.]|nr:hypothetical protein [Rhizomicrobium sp.]
MRAFPMILIAVLAYNALVFGARALGHDPAALLAQNFPVTVMSGDVWKISLGDGLLTLSLLLLFLETIKAARAGHREIIHHVLSVLTFAAALAEFILLKGFGTSVFFLITLLCLFDLVAGSSLAIVAAKRDVPPPEPEANE